MRIVRATSAAELADARALVEEYVASLHVSLAFQDYADEIAAFPGAYAPPSGEVLLAYEGGDRAGVAALRRLDPSVCEMKRMYIRPAFRGQGTGRALAVQLIRDAVVLGYSAMRLDTLASMDAALGLYRSLGFVEIPAYRYNPIAGARFLELDLRPKPL